MNETIQQLIKESIKAKEQLLAADRIAEIEAVARAIIDGYRAGKKVLVCGNGGSAADAQHLAAELVVRFQKNRAALAAIALTTDSSNLTAIGNDFGFDHIFSRQVEALAAAGDIVIGISTSGKSPNVVAALQQAKKQKAVTVALCGGAGGPMKELADLAFCAPSTVTARVQECHVLAIHIICTLVEETLFGQK